MSIRVLLVDDETALLRSLERVLLEHDLQVETATCAAEAAVFLNRYAFDVVVCDQNMPGQSGLELLTELRNKHPNLIMMILSGQIKGIPVAEHWAQEIGVAEVFSKPCDGNVIAERILSVMRSRQIAKSEG